MAVLTRQPERTRPPRTRVHRSRPRTLAIGMVAPAVVVLVAILGYPLGRLIVLALQEYGSRAVFTGDAPFVGLANITGVLGDGAFWAVLARTVLFAAVVVVALMLGGLGLSHLLSRVSGWARLATTVCLVLVWAMPMVAAALMWQWLFQPQYGVVNWMVSQLHVFGDQTASDWLAHPTSGMVLIMLLVVWKGLPFVAMTLYAAQSQIPAELYEAAGLDGATGLAAFRTITAPLLRPVLTVVALLEIIWSVNSFTPIWVLTQGGPNGQTTTLGVYSFLTAFARTDYGVGAAIALLTVLLLAAVAASYVRRLTRQGELA